MENKWHVNKCKQLKDNRHCLVIKTNNPDLIETPYFKGITLFNDIEDVVFTENKKDAYRFDLNRKVYTFREYLQEELEYDVEVLVELKEEQ